jgi:transcriptional regulator with XRE-family HTH domain
MNAAEALWADHLQRLGAFIKAQRRLNQLSQRQLAKLADLSDAYMSRIERGRHEPSLTVLRALADGLGIRADRLILYAARLPVPDGTPSTEDAIRSDPRLSAAQRAALLDVLHTYLTRNEAVDATVGR